LAVFVLDKCKEPLMPCSEKRARLLLTCGRAVVVRRYPFTIRLKDRVGGEVQPVRVKIDPGSKTTGIAEDFLAGKPAVFARITAQARAPLKDAAAVNPTRRPLYEVLADTGLPVEASSGGCTTHNRARLGIPKTHARDAACVGAVATRVGWAVPTLEIKATGGGDYCRTKLTAHGFARGYCRRTKAVRGFQRGDMVRAEVPNGKKAGVHVGRVAVRASGSFVVGNADGTNATYCKILYRADRDGYGWRPALPPRPERRGFQCGGLR
jgi:hypothetical protein